MDRDGTRKVKKGWGEALPMLEAAKSGVPEKKTDP